MKKLFYGGLIFDAATHTFVKKDILTENDRIVAVGESGTIPDDASRIDCSGLYIIPGLVDVHTHGRAGYDFTTVPQDKLADVFLAYAKAGTTSVMPTLASAPYETWIRSAKMLADYKQCSSNGAYMVGIHMEGRYLSDKRRGAHAAELLALPSSNELSDLADAVGNTLVHISLAPEIENCDTYISAAISAGMTVGIAHSDCTYEQAEHALSLGVSSFTHTYNAMSPLHHRLPGCVGASLLMNDAYSEIICDGMHSHPAMTDLLSRCKPQDKLVLITDSMEATGCADGNYSIAGLPVIVKNGMALNSEGSLAGSTLTLFDGLTNYMRFAKRTLEEAIPCATENPARMIGAYDEVGSIEVSKRADFLLISNPEAPVLKTVVCGGSII